MKLIVGLGNPGLEYERTRHNAGFMSVDVLARRHSVGGVARSKFHAALIDAPIRGEKCVLMKPTTFMNRSGLAVGETVRFYKLEPAEDLVVIYDEVDLPVGHIRVRPGGGSGSHNGVSDIDRALGGADYTRVRVGVGKTPQYMNRADWVLSRFMDEERDDAARGVESAADAVEMILDSGVDAAMNAFNKKLSPQKPADAGPGPGERTGSQQHNDTNTPATKQGGDGA